MDIRQTDQEEKEMTENTKRAYREYFAEMETEELKAKREEYLRGHGRGLLIALSGLELRSRGEVKDTYYYGTD